MTSFTRYLAYTNAPNPQFQLSDLKFTVANFWKTVRSSSYLAALKKTVGAKRADTFAKLYMFPGVAHCGGGVGPNTFDVLTPVMAWAETATKPGRIVAANVTDGTVTRTRPVYPYPEAARYDGTGSVDDAASGCSPPTTQTTCRVVDGELECADDKKRAARGATGLVLAHQPAPAAGRSHR